MKINIAVFFGGVSAEHEVSVITGLQVIEKIDRNKFNVFAICLTQKGTFEYYPKLHSRKDYFKIKPKLINFGKDNKGSYFRPAGLVSRKIYIDVAYLAFHGGNGESGQMQGFLDVLDIAFTSPGVESSSISMNKVLTKEVLESHGVTTLPWVRLFSIDIKKDPDKEVDKVLEKLSLPVIVKPVHLGSSIAVKVARSKIELKKYLLEASYLDSEILVEDYLKKFNEYNISVKKVNDKYLLSEIEKPLSKDEILSFADKYQSGSKKTGGMASLTRDLPAKIPENIKKYIEESAIKVFELIRATGLVRVDFMLAGSNIYVIEVNPIPGSMSFFLWEASGISFRDQITELILEAIKNKKESDSIRFKYESDIIKKFVA